MRRAFVILAVLAITLSLPCSFLIAEETGEKSDEARERTMEKERGEEPARHPEEAERMERRERREEPVRHPEEAERMERRQMEKREGEREMREMPERLYEKLFRELERQRNEIRELRQEIISLRRMLERQYPPCMMYWRGWRWEDEPERRMPERMREGDEPYRERRDAEERRVEIKEKIKMLQEEVERNPDAIDPRMDLAHLYLELDMIDAAVGQYKRILEMEPDLDAPYKELEKLRRKFPDMFGEKDKRKEEKQNSFAGEVVSSNKEELKLKVLEGDEVVTFRVPYRKKDDGSWALNGDISEFVASLKPGQRIKLLWREGDEDRKVITRIEKMKE